MPENKDAMIQARVPHGVRARLEKLARLDHRTLSDYLRRILEKHVEGTPEEKKGKAA